MLQFYYEFLDKYSTHADFHMCEKDTDSAYIAIAGNSVKFSEIRVAPRISMR